MATITYPDEEFSFSRHALAWLAEQCLSEHDVFEAAADGVRIARAGGYREFRGSNGVCFIVSGDGVIVTVLPRDARTVCLAAAGSGSNRHRRFTNGRRRPSKRPQDSRPGRCRDTSTRPDRNKGNGNRLLPPLPTVRKLRAPQPTTRSESSSS